MGFQGVYFDDLVVDAEKPSCIFPEDCGNDPTTCMECFLNQNQPHSEYEYFYLKFWVSEYSLPGRSLEDMTPEIPYQFTSSSDRIKFRIWNQEDFIDPEYEDHNIECDKINRWDGNNNNLNIWITKLNDNTWRITVGGEDLLVQETYTTTTGGNKKGKGGKTETVVPLEATGNFSFYIDFIKISPPTN